MEREEGEREQTTRDEERMKMSGCDKCRHVVKDKKRQREMKIKQQRDTARY